jgi:hypothetical protein
MHSTERQAMDPHVHHCQLLNRSAHIHCIASSAVELGHDEHVFLVEPVNEIAEAFSLHRCC